MSLPVVLIHGYSTEGQTTDGGAYTRESVASLYGRMVQDLATDGTQVVPVNVSRYVSLDDGVNLDDLSLSMDRVLRTQHQDLLEGGFNAIIHSTGALVARNWIRRHNLPGKPCPMKRLIHLAGANLGSGWAHVGATQFAKFARMIQGVQRGLAVLEGLELGSDWAIDLHRHFLMPGQDMLKDYGVMEFCLVGSQVPPEYLVIPTRYGKEDGSDGVVRVSASNLNFNYMKIAPTADGRSIDWDEALAYARKATRRLPTSGQPDSAFEAKFYEVSFDSQPGRPPEGSEAATGATTRPRIPFAIPYNTSHSDMSKKTAIVYGSENRDFVLPLVRRALGAGTNDYAAIAEEFAQATRQTEERVKADAHPKNIWARMQKAVRDMLDNPRAQYDRHSQLVFRVCDHLGEPITDFSVFFNSFTGGAPEQLINKLFQDKHKNGVTPNVINFYIRTEAWRDEQEDWTSQLDGLKGVSLEVDAIDPVTQRVLYLPLRVKITTQELKKWIEPHRTTIVDVRLMRLPHKVTFILR